MKGMEVVKRGTQWRVGNGNMIHIWGDKWLPTPTTYKIISPQLPYDDFSMVSTLIDRDTKRWNADLVRSIFLPFEANAVLNIPLSHNLPDGKIIQVGNKKCEFTVKSVYYIAIEVIKAADEGESSTSDPRTALWKKLCHLNIPTKIRICAWRMCMDGLPTMVNLQKRGVNGCELCPSCGEEPELVLHSLVRWEVARRVWDCWVNCLVDFLSAAMDITDVALKICECGITQDVETFFGVAWAIWYNRNQVVFESSCQLPIQIWNFAIRYLQDFKSASAICSHHQSLARKKWTKPPPRTFKINVDGATSENGKSSSVGVAIRDLTGMITAAWCKYLRGLYSVTETEALAIKCGVLLARDMELSHIIIESDALVAIQGILAAEAVGSLGHVY